MAPKQSKRKKIIFITLGFFLVVLIALRIALSYILLKLVNKQLSHIKGYDGHVDDIDVALIRGAYVIKTLKLNKTGGKIPVPFLSLITMDLSLEWNALFHGKIAGKIRVNHPVLNFVKGPSEETSQTKIDSSWADVISNLMPLTLNRLEIDNGEIHFRDFHSSPKIDLFKKTFTFLP